MDRDCGSEHKINGMFAYHVIFASMEAHRRAGRNANCDAEA